MNQAAKLVNDILRARLGSISALLRVFGRELADYASAIVPSRGERFERLLEDILVDIVSQCRAADTSSDDTLRRYIFESACRTVRARHRELIDAPAKTPRAPSSYTLEEALKAMQIGEGELARLVSDGTIRAFREENTTKFRPQDIQSFRKAPDANLECISAREREALALYFRFNFDSAAIARWHGAAPAAVEELIETAAGTLVSNHLVKESFA